MIGVPVADEEGMQVAEELVTLLEAHPEAWVGAVGPDVLFVPMPASVPVNGHRRLPGRWILDHVAPADRGPASDAWRAMGDERHASIRVHLRTGGMGAIDVFKVADVHGADVLVLVTDDDDDLAASTGSVETGLSSRFTRIIRAANGQTLELDAASEQVLGWPAEVLLGPSPVLERVHPEDRSEILQNWMLTMNEPASGHRSRTRFLRGDGSYIWVEVTNFNRLDDPVRACIVSEIMDISEEMAAHEKVRAREQLLHRLAEALPLGVLQLDVDRSIVYRNDYLTAIIGAEDAATMKEQFEEIVEEDAPMLWKAFDAALVDGDDDDVVVRMTPHGARSEQLVRVITKSLSDDNGDHTGVIACISDVTETELMGRELERRATFDALTGCLNRAAILTRLDGVLAPGDGGAAAIFLDLDDFKDVNDRCGHAVGDEMLKAAARVLETAIRDGDHVGRLGGDEFLVVCHDVSDANDAMSLARRISTGLRSHPTVLGSHVPLKASIGVAWSPRGSITSEKLVERSDLAMYTSKRGGIGEPHLWDDESVG